MNGRDEKIDINDVLFGKIKVRNGDAIQAAASYLRTSKGSSSLVKENQSFREKETEKLIQFINDNELWDFTLDFAKFISSGAEQRVYISDGHSVYKLNDAIYYTSWLDYFYSLLLNNYFFSDTAYRLKGFYKAESNILYALVEQPYISATEPTNLELVKEFLKANGFDNIKNNDYFNAELGIILEDLHDENVLTRNHFLYFIDTVFYLNTDNKLSQFLPK